ncbi:MAG TPA: hypothetical protein VFD70_04740 [Anaerolineae bacterium]|nr:hypothetical protein [Anaerolineae bacterium]
MRETLKDDKAETNVAQEELDLLEPSAAEAAVTRGTPTRRVGKLSVGAASKVPVKRMDSPPRRRAASVFGTRGREIVPYPAQTTNPVTVQDVAFEKGLPTEKEYEHSEIVIEESEAIGVQETERHNIEMRDDGQETNDDASAEIFAGRPIYVRFKELPDDTGAAYIHVLMGLFTENPGTDVVALVFDRANEIIEIAAPNGVDYNEVSEVVQNIIGEDAVVEVIE